MRKINYDGIIIHQPESYMDGIVLAKSDFHRYYGKEASMVKMLLYSITYLLSFRLIFICDYLLIKALAGGGGVERVYI